MVVDLHIFPGRDHVSVPLMEFRYAIEIEAAPEAIWPWLKQLGYHRAGWYIDAWWDRWEQTYFWPRVVPPEARGTYEPPADRILPQWQGLKLGDTIPDGPPGSVWYDVVGLERNALLLLRSTTHFKYAAPRFVYRTRHAPKGVFVWAFVLESLGPNRTRVTSWWQAEGTPRLYFVVMNRLLAPVDALHQRAMLRGLKRRVEAADSTHQPGELAQEHESTHTQDEPSEEAL